MDETRWRVYHQTEDAWNGMLECLENAKHSIHLKDYILRDTDENDAIGRVFIDLLKKKAREGLRVNIVLDMFGAGLSLFRGAKEELVAAGATVMIHTITLQKRFPFHFFVRDHRKLLLIDERIAFLGGVIIQERARVWRDTHLRLIGPITEDIMAQFVATWRGLEEYIGPQTLLAHDRHPALSVIASGPGEAHKQILHVLLDRIKNAKEYIYITTPLFSPPRIFFTALKKAQARGVKVVVILPGSGMEGPAKLATLSYHYELLRAGITVYLYPIYIHAKIVIIDGWVTVGSTNIDRWSLLYNYELNITSGYEVFNKEMLERFAADVRYSRLLTMKDLQRRTLRERFKISILGYLFRPIG